MRVVMLRRSQLAELVGSSIAKQVELESVSRLVLLLSANLHGGEHFLQVALQNYQSVSNVKNVSSSRESCLKFSKDKCLNPFWDARIALLDPKKLRKGEMGATNFRGSMILDTEMESKGSL